MKEHTFTCERCRAKVDGLYHEDPLPSMAAMGWHNVSDKWLCSRACLEWFVFLAKREAEHAKSDLKPVMGINDRAYQVRRAAAQAVAAPVAAKK